MRVLKSSEEFFDLLDKLPNGQFVTIGYVTSAEITATVKRRNPDTGRMKGYPDYSVLGSDNEIGALVKITSYNMPYLNRKTVAKRYGEFKNSVNDIRSDFGLEPMGDKEGYTHAIDYGNNGVSTYGGNKDDLMGHTYYPQNIASAKKIKSIVYAVNNDGHIVEELKPEQVDQYLKRKNNISGVAALKKMNADDERIQDYISRIKSLNFSYKAFEADSILWIAATVDGEKIVYINDNLKRAVDGINIRPEDFRAIARERYQIDLASLHEGHVRRSVVRLTESDLHRVIKESVNRILNEAGVMSRRRHTFRRF